jgi:uncharacterized protein
MYKKQMSRKEFFTKTLTAIAGVSIISKSMNRFLMPVPELKELGRTGISVSPVCFGATRTNDEALIKYVLSKGINFIDTGRSYANGNNEKLVGKAIAGMRRNVVVQSKIRLEADELPSKGKGRKGSVEIKDALSKKLEASLKALNTEYIDILLYHEATDEKLLFHSETMKFFSDMKNKGTIKAHGFSTHNDFMNLPERNNAEGFYNAVMVPFNHKGSFVHSITGSYSEWDQSRLISVLTEAWEKGIGVIAMKTCSGGKYSPSADIKPSYKEAVLWVLHHKFISSASIAMSNFEQVNEHADWLRDLKF